MEAMEAEEAFEFLAKLERGTKTYKGSYITESEELNSRCPVPILIGVGEEERTKVKDWLSCRKKVREEIRGRCLLANK